MTAHEPSRPAAALAPAAEGRAPGAADPERRARQLEAEVARLRTLLGTARALYTEGDPERLIKRIIEAGASAVDADRATLFLLDRQRRELVSRIALGVEGPLQVPLTEGVAGHVARTAETVNIPDAYEDARFSRRVDEETGYRTRTILAAPIRAPDGEVAGVIQALNKKGHDGAVGVPFSREDEEALAAVGALAAIALESARRLQEVKAERETLREEVRELSGEFVGVSPAMRDVKELALKIARSPVTVLITGESGTGKSHIARLIHVHSDRYAKPFVYLNCAAIPEALVESELFGIERGVATGVEKKVGRIEQAEGGTLFLDEIGDMAKDVQAKILQVLQEREVVRVGGRKPIRVDVRVISATNTELAKEVDEGRFREDLYYRLKVVTVEMPSLRARKEDIQPLLDYLLEKACREYNRKMPAIGDAAMRALLAYDWPGNVRELDNEARRIVSLAPPDGPAEPAHLSESVRTGAVRQAIGGLVGRGTLEEAVEALETGMIKQALGATGGNKAAAARMLGLSREGLRKKMKRYGME